MASAVAQLAFVFQPTLEDRACQTTGLQGKDVTKPVLFTTVRHAAGHAKGYGHWREMDRTARITDLGQELIDTVDYIEDAIRSRKAFLVTRILIVGRALISAVPTRYRRFIGPRLSPRDG